MSAQPDKAAKIFDVAVELADPGERAAYLETACGHDRELRAEVEQLLHHADAAGSFLKPAGDAPDKEPWPRIDPYGLGLEEQRPRGSQDVQHCDLRPTRAD